MGFRYLSTYRENIVCVGDWGQGERKRARIGERRWWEEDSVRGQKRRKGRREKGKRRERGFGGTSKMLVCEAHSLLALGDNCSPYTAHSQLDSRIGVVLVPIEAWH